MAANIRIFRYVVPVSADQPSHSYLVNKNQVLLRKTGPMAHMFTKEILWQHIFKSNQNFTPRQPPVAFLFHQVTLLLWGRTALESVDTPRFVKLHQTAHDGHLSLPAPLVH